jgi:hypothetical protein
MVSAPATPSAVVLPTKVSRGASLLNVVREMGLLSEAVVAAGRRLNSTNDGD